MTRPYVSYENELFGDIPYRVYTTDHIQYRKYENEPNVPDHNI